MNIGSTRPDLTAALEVARVEGPSLYNFHGRTKRTSNRPLVVRVPESTPRVVAEIGNDLYMHFYTRQGPMPPILPDPTLVDEFCAALSNHNKGKGNASRGWNAVRDLGNRLVVENRAGVRRTVAKDHFSAKTGGGIVLRPKDSFKREPVFYYAYSDHDIVGRSYDAAVRLYFAIAPIGAPSLVASITGRLNTARIPFRFKMLKDPQRYYRADRSVLYLHREDWNRAVPVVASVWRDVRRYLVDKTPAFSKRIGPGFALAESPLTDAIESFGTHRCRLIAEGLYDASIEGVSSPEETLPFVEKRFAAERISCDHLHLREGTHDPY